MKTWYVTWTIGHGNIVSIIQTLPENTKLVAIENEAFRGMNKKRRAHYEGGIFNYLFQTKAENFEDACDNVARCIVWPEVQV